MSKFVYCLTFACCMFVASARAEAASVTLAWDPNGEADLAGYIVLFGTQSGRYDRVLEVGNTTTWTFTEAEVNKTYYFVVQAVNTSGARSEFSAEVAATIGGNGEVQPGPNPTPPGTGTRLAVNRSSFTIGAVAGTNGLRSAAQKAAVTFSNGSSNWTATSDVPWLQINGGSGSGAGSFTVSLKSGTYTPSNHSATITISAPDAPNSPVTIPVTLHVFESGENPSGMIDTPVNNATGVRGSIAITGWATDDIDVKEVSIYRDPVIGEAAWIQKVQVFVGRAVFVDGARPDVDAALTQPFDYEAGWGYMLLTRMLPGQGNGTYKLHAYATDVEGHTVLLGSRTITCNNSSSNKPFGAIDTPDQGGTVSGTTYVNYGWALTPQPNSIKQDGSTIMVYIDGVPVGRPVYNNYRADIATTFFGYANTGGAIGYYTFDTTKLANGVHTIGWVVTDSAGNSEGIGSRYFTVLNGSDVSTMNLEASTSIQGDETRVSAAVGASSGLEAGSLEAIPVSTVPVYRRDGFDQNASLELAPADEFGVVRINADAVGRFTLTLSAPVKDERGGYEGYLVADGKLQALPAGSFLDKRAGEFYWQPGVGFVGNYQLVFVRTEGGQRVRIPVDVTIGTSPAQSKPRLVIDLPSANGTVGTTFVAAGWAADFAASTGSGIRTVHVWAYPTAPGSEPIFVGEAVMGADRPDVGIIHGKQYDHAGFHITGTLNPGSYNLVVYAFSELAKDFNNAVSVPIIVK